MNDPSDSVIRKRKNVEKTPRRRRDQGSDEPPAEVSDPEIKGSDRPRRAQSHLRRLSRTYESEGEFQERRRQIYSAREPQSVRRRSESLGRTT